MTASAVLVDGASERQLDVSLVSDASGRTYIGGQYVAYPFHLCRALRNLGDPSSMPTLYIQSCSGGLFQGEDLRCRFRVGPNAQAHITTAASTIVHSMEQGTAAQRVDIEVGAGAYFEYLPEPMILFPDASVQSSVFIRAARGATILACDSFLAHDPKAAGKVFREFSSELSVMDEEDLLLARDRYRVEGCAFQRPTPGVMGSYRTQAGFVLVRRGGPIAEWTDRLRDTLTDHPEAYVGVSALPNDAGVWVRLLAPDAAIMRNVLAALWSRAREMITGVVPTPRRK